LALADRRTYLKRSKEDAMQTPDNTQHWRDVYASKDARSVSWFQGSPTPSLRLIGTSGLGPGSRAIDVGGGASSLVDHLLDQGLEVTVLDLAPEALDVSRARLGARATAVRWIAADITQWEPSGQFDLWHDRAVFHFLIEPAQRAAYRAAMETGLKPGGWLVMATFAPQGPDRCSGLPVQRWSAADLASFLGEQFQLIASAEEAHETPWGAPQIFTWTLFRRAP
jgi:2-polyprenyl-3-methyl-5-hydroxy-6-metoxy-1,4-benzoquinol methylase